MCVMYAKFMVLMLCSLHLTFNKVGGNGYKCEMIYVKMALHSILRFLTESSNKFETSVFCFKIAELWRK